MMDLDRLDEALEWYDKAAEIASVDLNAVDPLQDVVAAARAYRDLANGERVEWCETHHMSTNPDSTRCLRWMELVDAELAGIRDCRIVSKLLSTHPTTEED